MFGAYVKMSDVDLKKLPAGTYYYCAKCKTWFGKERPLPSQPCPDCGSSWAATAGIYEKKSSKADKPGAAKPKRRGLGGEYLTALVVILFLVAAGCCYFVVIPTVQRGIRQSESALAALTAVLVSLGALTAATLLLFILLTVLLILLLTVGAAAFESEEGTSSWARAWDAVSEHGRLVGTLFNVLASLGALLLVSTILGRPPGPWDLAIQTLVALILERAIIRHWDRYLGRLHALLA